MWKPGAGKPSTPNKSGSRKPKSSPRSLGEDDGNDDDKDNVTAVAASTKSPVVKKLSSGTMNMRFMQRRTASVSPKRGAVVQQTQVATTPMPPTTPRQHISDAKSNRHNTASPMEDVEYHDNDNQQQQSENEDDVNDNYIAENITRGRFTVASAQDMYGPTLMGRRSFGGFHPVVEQMHQQQVAAVEKSSAGSEASKRKRKRNKK